MLQMLLEAGSEVNEKEIKGRTKLHDLAADRCSGRKGNSVNFARLLLARGSGVGTRDAEGKTAPDLLRTEYVELAQQFGPRTPGLHAVKKM